MNPNRSTGGEFSPLAYLNVIERGTDTDWAQLLQLCRIDPKVRKEVIDLLPMGDPLQRGVLLLWADLLGVRIDIADHPGL
ncbi:MAG: hypothetical protein PHE83_16710 [Opitutaceae bacterium]|nr:hypothetical protein [Opitutaceae bacterium]